MGDTVSVSTKRIEIDVPRLRRDLEAGVPPREALAAQGFKPNSTHTVLRRRGWKLVPYYRLVPTKPAL